MPLLYPITYGIIIKCNFVYISQGEYSRIWLISFNMSKANIYKLWQTLNSEMRLHYEKNEMYVFVLMINIRVLKGGTITVGSNLK